MREWEARAKVAEYERAEAQRSYCKAADERNAAEKRVVILLATLKECSDELAEWVQGHYGGMLHYPSEKRRFDRDMEPVLRARALLKSLRTQDTNA